MNRAHEQALVKKRKAMGRHFVNRSVHEVLENILSTLKANGGSLTTKTEVMYRNNLNSKQIEFYRQMLLRTEMMVEEKPRPNSKRLYWKATPKGVDYIATFGKLAAMLAVPEEKADAKSK